MNEMSNDDLDPNEIDALAATGRALISAIPMVGGIIGEIITQRLPAQRQDRIVDYIRDLNELVVQLKLSVEQIYSDPVRIDLIEEGGFQAARALSKDRISQIAMVVANGLVADDALEIRRKRLLTLLGQLDDDEVLILNAYGQSYGTGDYTHFDAINRPDHVHMGSSVQEVDANSLFDAGEAKLLRLGLLKKNYGQVARGAIPEFDTSKGDFKHHLEVSYLGRMLLRSLGKPSPYDISED